MFRSADVVKRSDCKIDAPFLQRGGAGRLAFPPSNRRLGERIQAAGMSVIMEEIAQELDEKWASCCERRTRAGMGRP